MPISSSNAVLNQYVPPFCINKPVNGDILVYDASKQTWKNTQTASPITPADLEWQDTYAPGQMIVLSDDLQSFAAVDMPEAPTIAGYIGQEEGITNVVDALNHLYMHVTSSKQAIVDAATEAGIHLDEDPTFEQIADAIRAMRK